MKFSTESGTELSVSEAGKRDINSQPKLLCCATIDNIRHGHKSIYMDIDCWG